MGSKGNWINLWRKIPYKTITYKDTIFFLRKSLSCEFLEIRRGFGESVAVYAFLLWAVARSKLMDELDFWSDLLGCSLLVNNFCLLWGFSWGIRDPSDLLFNIFDIWQLCLIGSLLPLLFQMSLSWIASSLRWILSWSVNTYCKLIIYPAQMEDSYFSVTVDSSVPNWKSDLLFQLFQFGILCWTNVQ